MENKSNLGSFGIGALIGLIIGGVVGILYAPVSGNVARQEVIKKVRDIRGKFTKNRVDNSHIK